MDVREPLDVGHSVPPGNQQSKRETLVASERLAIQRIGQERLGRQRHFARQAAAKLLVHLVDDPAEVHLFLTVIGAKEDELACPWLHAGLIEHCLQRDTRPAAVARETLQRTTIAGALEPEHEFGPAHSSQVIERERFRPFHQPGDLQRKSRGVYHWMAEVLRREELILRSERTVDLSYIESSPFRTRCRIEVRRQVGEGYDGFALRERRDGPVRHQRQQARRRQSSSHSLSTGDVFRHASPPGRSQGILPPAIGYRQRVFESGSANSCARKSPGETARSGSRPS